MNNIIVQISHTETREVYEAPVIERIDVRVEQGFQGTSPGLGGNPNDDDQGGSF
jgi:hypothetical protein